MILEPHGGLCASLVKCESSVGFCLTSSLYRDYQSLMCFKFQGPILGIYSKRPPQGDINFLTGSGYVRAVDHNVHLLLLHRIQQW